MKKLLLISAVALFLTGTAAKAQTLEFLYHGESLPDYLDRKVFASARSSTLMADADEIEGFNAFLDRYRKALEAERTLVEVF